MPIDIDHKRNYNYGTDIDDRYYFNRFKFDNHYHHHVHNRFNHHYYNHSGADHNHNDDHDDHNDDDNHRADDDHNHGAANRHQLCIQRRIRRAGRACRVRIGGCSSALDPIRDGYIFRGWFSNIALTFSWDFGSDTVTAT
ncbi:MAG: InlB B-repeat-containing protein [Bacillus subtilis]|nr:InlB B-repeat-containing protein [Bacillus subtilis]